jgi:hypothetical protein
MLKTGVQAFENLQQSQGISHRDGRVWDGRVWDGRVWDGRVWDGRVWDV